MDLLLDFCVATAKRCIIVCLNGRRRFGEGTRGLYLKNLHFLLLPKLIVESASYKQPLHEYISI